MKTTFWWLRRRSNTSPRSFALSRSRRNDGGLASPGAIECSRTTHGKNRCNVSIKSSSAAYPERRSSARLPQIISRKRVVDISIFGLGYVGAVSLACLARDGHRVVGVDVDQTKLDLIGAGKTPVVEEGMVQL